jgi:hypothetical protein
MSDSQSESAHLRLHPPKHAKESDSSVSPRLLFEPLRSTTDANPSPLSESPALIFQLPGAEAQALFVASWLKTH